MSNVSNSRSSSRGKVTSAFADKVHGPNGQDPPEVDWTKKFYLFNDAGRAKRFVERFGKNLRFVPEQGCWFVWNGMRWKVDTDGAVERLAVALSSQ